MLQRLGRTTAVLAALGLLTVLTTGQPAPAGEDCCGVPEPAATPKTKPGLDVCDAKGPKQKEKENGEGGPADCKADCPVVHLLRPYFAIRKALAADSLDGVADAAAKLAKCSGCRIGKKPGDALVGALGKLSNAAKPLLQAASKGDLAAARKAFHDLSKAAIALVESAEKAGKKVGGVTIYGCGMSKPFGKWLQRSGAAMGNPYQGSKMLGCGKPVRTIGAGGKAGAAGAKKDCCAGEKK